MKPVIYCRVILDKIKYRLRATKNFDFKMRECKSCALTCTRLTLCRLEVFSEMLI